MSHSFRCPKTGLAEWFDSPGEHPCPFCKGKHSTEITGPPKKQEGFGMAPPPFKRHYSPVHGRKLTSWTEYRDANKELGIVYTGEKPPKDQYNTGRKTSGAGLRHRG